MKAKLESVSLDPRQKKATVAFSTEHGAWIQVLGMSFDPPEGLAYERTEEMAVKEAVRLLNSVRTE